MFGSFARLLVAMVIGGLGVYFYGPNLGLTEDVRPVRAQAGALIGAMQTPANWTVNENGLLAHRKANIALPDKNWLQRLFGASTVGVCATVTADGTILGYEDLKIDLNSKEAGEIRKAADELRKKLRTVEEQTRLNKLMILNDAMKNESKGSVDPFKKLVSE